MLFDPLSVDPEGPFWSNWKTYPFSVFRFIVLEKWIRVYPSDGGVGMRDAQLVACVCLVGRSVRSGRSDGRSKLLLSVLCLFGWGRFSPLTTSAPPRL